MSGSANGHEPTPTPTPTPARNETLVGLSADIYDEHTLRQHIYEVPDTYIGSDERVERQEMLLDIQEMILKPSQTDWPEGCERLFLEILANAVDNVGRSRNRNLPVGSIHITMDHQTIKIRNNGLPIPIQINKKSGKWAPDLIFGTLLTGSNYDPNRKDEVSGRNGYGAKLCNIFSKHFKVKVGDCFNHQEYTQEWSENMTIRNDPTFVPYYPHNKESYVEIEFTMDFKRFKYDCYPANVFSLYARHAADASFNGKLPVFFNDVELKTQDIISYARLFYPEQVERCIVHYEWPLNTKTVNKTIGQNVTKVATDSTIIPLVEVCVIDTPDNGSVISYVNGIITRDGGVHVDLVVRLLGEKLLEQVNDKPETKKDKTKDKTKDKPTVKDKLQLGLGDVRRHLSFIVSCRIVQPKYFGQTKSRLTSPKPHISFPDDIIKPMSHWNIKNRLDAELKSRIYKALSKTDGAKRRYISDIPKLEDANEAGSSKSHQCTLILTEGNSAALFAEEFVACIPSGRDFFGWYPMKGKPLNVLNADNKRILENTEIKDLKQIFGLAEGVDYSIEANFKTLRYGQCMIMADSDEDGKHIMGLILLFFYCRYPSLIWRNYVVGLRTPIIIATSANHKLKERFYSHQAYHEWEKKTSNAKSWEINYYKGLASCKPVDADVESKVQKTVVFIYDDTTSNYFQLAFNDKNADARKTWIECYSPLMNIEDIQTLPISYFINYELIQHSLVNLRRSIPAFDGLKLSQRKILWGSVDSWGWNVTKAKKIKTSILVAHVIKVTGYHYGDKSLVDAVNHMALDFSGSNNLPYFNQEGMFGTRSNDGAESGEARYTAVTPQWWWPYIYLPEDHGSSIEFCIDEGMKTEPVLMLPIIPMLLVNGSKGIGTGHSTYIPPYNPLDICQWILNKLRNKALPKLIPWFRGFNGHVHVEERKAKPKEKKEKHNEKANGTEPTNTELTNTELTVTETPVHNGIHHEQPTQPTDVDGNGLPISVPDDSQLEPDEEMVSSSTRYALVTSGVFRHQYDKDGVIVTELPIGRASRKYRIWLDQLRADKLITNYVNKSTPNKPCFFIYGFEEPSLETLHLKRTFGLSNMVVINPEGKPVRYETVDQLFEAWFLWRIKFYQVRKDRLISDLDDKIQKKTEKIRFIRAILDGHKEGAIPGKTIHIVAQTSKQSLHQQMDLMNFDHELAKTTMYNLTQDDIDSLSTEISELVRKRDESEKKHVNQYWIDDLQSFMSVYHKRYPEDKGTLKTKK